MALNRFALETSGGFFFVCVCVLFIFLSGVGLLQPQIRVWFVDCLGLQYMIYRVQNTSSCCCFFFLNGS